MNQPHGVPTLSSHFSARGSSHHIRSPSNPNSSFSLFPCRISIAELMPKFKRLVDATMAIELELSWTVLLHRHPWKNTAVGLLILLTMLELRSRRARVPNNSSPTNRLKQGSPGRRRNTAAVRNRGRPKKEDVIGGVDKKRGALKAKLIELEEGQRSEGPMDEDDSGCRSCDKAEGAEEEGSTAPLPDRVPLMWLTECLLCRDFVSFFLEVSKFAIFKTIH